MSQLVQRQVQPEELLIIGDTIEDIACAQAHGIPILSVATGCTSVEDLAKHRPDYALDDLTDFDHVMTIFHHKH